MLKDKIKNIVSSLIKENCPVLSGRIGVPEGDIKNIIEPYLKEIISSSKMRSHPIYLGNNLMLCQMIWGGWVVVPTYNIDVAIGAIRDGCIESATTQFVIENLHFGQCYVNVGANFGYYTSLGGNIVGDKGFVYSYEANPVMFAILMRTLFYSGVVNRVKAFNRAVSNSLNEVIDFFFDYQFIGGGFAEDDPVLQPNSLFEGDLIWNNTNIESQLNEDGSYKVGTGLYTKIKTKTTILDATISHDKIDMIQCDAEGSEPYILLGAKKIIARSRDIKIVFEWGTHYYIHRGEVYKNAFCELWRFLNSEGFTIRKISTSLQNGKTNLSEPMTFDAMTQSAEHGDYYACRE